MSLLGLFPIGLILAAHGFEIPGIICLWLSLRAGVLWALRWAMDRLFKVGPL